MTSLARAGARHHGFGATCHSLALAGVALSAAPLGAQIEPGYRDVGPVIGVGASRPATASAGFRYEMILRQQRWMGDGMFGYAVGADVYRYLLPTRPKASPVFVFPISMLGTYHPRIDPTRRLDAFAGAGITFEALRCQPSDVAFDFLCPRPRATFAGRVGGRYFVRRTVALYGDLSSAGMAVNLGVTFTDRPSVAGR